MRDEGERPSRRPSQEGVCTSRAALSVLSQQVANNWLHPLIPLTDGINSLRSSDWEHG